jgi:DNA-binding MarR family transcriptional regulator
LAADSAHALVSIILCLRAIKSAHRFALSQPLPGHLPETLARGRYSRCAIFPRFLGYVLFENLIDLVNDFIYYMGMEKHEWSGEVNGLKHKGGEPHLIFEIMRTHHALMNVFSRKVGMPFSRLALLRVLALAFPVEIGILEIARRLNINGAAVTRQIRDMDELGLIARAPDERDGRRCNVKLTAKGRKLFEQIHERQHELEKYFASGELTLEEIQTAAKVLIRLRSALEKID